MKDQINQELIKLQQELSKIQTAADQLSKAEDAASELVTAVSDLQAKYSESVAKITQLTEEYLSDNIKNTQTKLDEILLPHKTELENTSKAIEELEKTVRISETKSSESIAALVESHKVQIENVNKILRNYIDLAASTARLSDKIDTIDFPANLGKISVNISEINGELRTIKTDIASINPVFAEFEKRIKRNNKKINFAMTIGMIAFIVLLFVAYQTVLIRYFPNVDVLKDFLPE